MNAIAKLEPKAPRSVLVDMSDRYGMEPAAFEATVRATVCKGNVSREEFAAFLLVAKEHRLNPLTKEIYAFPAKGGGIQPIVSIDGWARIINEHPGFDGMEFIDERDDGELVAITCRMFRKDRSHPIAATEYMAECRRTTDTWKTWPRRMLRHKAMIQAARYAFGFSGIVDPDEYERITTVHIPDQPNVRARLMAPGSEGFSTAYDARTGEIIEDPVAFAKQAEEVAEAEFIDPPHDDGLPVTEMEIAPETEAQAQERPAEHTHVSVGLADASFDALDWCASFTRGLDHLHTVEEVQDAWKTAKAAGNVVKLTAKNRAMAEALVTAVNERVAELKVGE